MTKAEANRLIRLVLKHRKERGVTPIELKHVPESYHITDFLSDLFVAAKQHGHDIKAILKDAMVGVRQKRAL